MGIMIAPKMMDPRIDTLVLGAWGCGAFGCDAHAMAQHFATALNQRLGEFYREVVFAIPDADQNAQIFERTLRAAGVPLVRKWDEDAHYRPSFSGSCLDLTFLFL